MQDKDANNPDLERRRFIRNAGTGALAVGGSSVLSVSAATEGHKERECKTPGCEYDVVVIGGGFAGVSAARDCCENGYKTLLLEASNRLGGRAFTADFGKDHIELGGAWIHWQQPFIWAEKERYGLKVKETPGAVPDRIIYFDGEKAEDLGAEDFVALFEDFRVVSEEAREIMPMPFDPKIAWDKVLEADKISAQDKLNEAKIRPKSRVFLQSLMAASAHAKAETWNYADFLRWSALSGYNDLGMYLDTSSRFKFQHGTISLIDAMIEDAKPDIQMSTPVKTVEDLGDKVRITSVRGKEFIAGTVICTVPLNVLPHVSFTPPLDSRVIEAAQEANPGTGVKVFIRVKGKVGKISCAAAQDHPLHMVFTYDEYEDHTILACFGIDSELIDYYDEEAVQIALRDYLPEAEVEAVTFYDWNISPYARSTYPHFRPHWFARYYDAFGKDIGRILFASGDYCEGWCSFFDGAMGDGFKAASRAKKILG